METETWGFEQLFKRFTSGEIQDETDVLGASNQFGNALLYSLAQPSDALVQSAQTAMLRALEFPEFQSSSFCGSASPVETAAMACARAQVVDSSSELPLLLGIVLRAYNGSPLESIKAIALLLGNLLAYRGQPSATLLKLALESLRVLICTAEQAQGLLQTRLLPLHAIQGKLSPTQSRLEGFHRELTLCVAKACSLSPSSWEGCFQELTSSLYPTMLEGNSPKEVLFLHEVETLLHEAIQLRVKLSPKSRACICTRLLQCISSQHGVVCERALSFWQSLEIFTLLQGSDQLLNKLCDFALSKASLEHWSQTVRSMAGAALLVGKGNGANAAPFVKQAMESAIEAQKQALLQASNLAAQTLPMPKTFSSTSVLRDAMEPFASGAFGVIWRGRAIVPGVPKTQWPLVALKELDFGISVQEEVEAMQSIGSHPNLVQLLGLFQSSNKINHLVLELMEAPPGDLHTVVLERDRLELNLVRLFALQIGNALQFIHGKNWVFADLKPENILVSSSGVLKLCDFGACVLASAAPREQRGTLEYFAPEQVSSPLADWWAFGCVIHFMITGKPPVFFESEAETDLPSAFSRAIKFADQQGGLLITDTTARSLVALLCSRDPAKRPRDGGESHAFFKSVRPWSSYQASPIQLPKPTRSGGKQAALAGPWQRRTFSTIHSPLPKPYQGLDAAFLSRCVVATLPTFALDWKAEDTSRLLALFEEKLACIPRNRIACANTTPLVVSAAGARRQVKPSYNVMGLDLTAG